MWLLTLVITVTLSSLLCTTPTAAQQRSADEKLLTLAITVMVGSVVSPDPTAARHRPAGQKSGRAPDISGPAPGSSGSGGSKDGVGKLRGPGAVSRVIGSPRLTQILGPPSRAREESRPR